MSRISFGPLFVATAVFAVGAHITSAPAAEDAQMFRQVVKTHPSQGEVKTVDGAEAVLATSEAGAFANLSTRDLIPGNAYTLWFVAINAPEACEGSPCMSPDVLERTESTKADVGYGDGLIAAADGTGHFTAYVPVGELPHAWFSGGLQAPQDAEIHLVVHDHGPLIPEMAETMLGTYRGGCTDESVPAAVPDAAKADGEPGPNACRLVQVAIFTPKEMEQAKAQ